MLIHECAECGTLSINRIAADDDPENILTIFQDSFLYGRRIRQLCEGQGIVLLSAEATKMVCQQLYGKNPELLAQ